MKKVSMRCGGLKMGLALAFALTLGTANAAAQANAGGVSKEEETEARAAAAAFAERLRATQDFAAVARELYADDFMSRQLKGLSDRAEGAGAKTFMLEGVPSLNFERSLAAKGDATDWKRMRLAADELLYFVFTSLIADHGFDELGNSDSYNAAAVLGVFPPEALKALDANPAASNLLLKRKAEVVVRTPEELRALADALEEAARLTRPRFAATLANGKHLEANLRLFAEASARQKVELAGEGEERVAGYPAGTRLYKVFAPNAYALRLVRVGGALKIVHAGLPQD